MIDVHNTFTPGQEIMNPEQFAGRKLNIAMAIKALCRPGTSILVYGDRGVGKSSFIEMIKLLAQDQVELVHRYGLKGLVPQHGFNYKIVAIECDEDTKTSEKVLQRLITSPFGFSQFIPDRITKIESTNKSSIGISLLKQLFSLSETEEEKFTTEKFKEKSIVELFTNIVQFVSTHILSRNEGLLIVIDEFDRVLENSKISSLIKTLSKNKVKFLISGIAKNYFELVSRHASIDRQLNQGKIKLEPMKLEEIKMLFKLAQEHNDHQVQFNRTLVEDINSKSSGYPYYVQLFGQLALDQFVDINGLEKKGTITKEHLKHSLKNFARSEPKLESLYASVIANDPERELMLKGMANLIPQKIRQSDLFKYCEKRGATNQKRTLINLLSYKNPDVLVRIDRETISFADPLFRIYAGTREPELISHSGELGLTIGSI